MNKTWQLLSILMFSLAFSQESQVSKPERILSKDSIYKTTDQPAEFPGGIGKFRQAFAQNFDATALNGKGEVNCELTFVILENGKVDNVKAVGEDAVFNSETRRAFLSLKNTKWIPAKINNVDVKSQYKMPLNMRFE